MDWAAPAQQQINNSSEISIEGMEKLQEIHELINLMFEKMTSKIQEGVNSSYLAAGMIHTMPPTTYGHSMFQYSWGMSPYMRLPRF